MYNAVYPVHKRPLVVRTNVDYEFTTIAVDQVTAADGNYEVLFLGTGEVFLVCLHFVVLIYFPSLPASVFEAAVKKNAFRGILQKVCHCELRVPLISQNRERQSQRDAEINPM